MGSNFCDRKYKIIAIESTGATRTLISELLREKGFTDIQAVPSIREALAVLETETVSWILTSVFADQDSNLFQLLHLMNRVPHLADVRVSAFVDATELELMPAAFELGLLSYHLKPFTKDKLKYEFDNLLSDFESLGWKSLNLSAAYLRKCLTESSLYPELLNFERQLMQAQPGNLQQMLNLALPLIKTNKVEEAKSVLWQVQKLDPSLEKQVKQITAAHLGNADLSAVKGSMNILNLKSAVIVENDSAIQKDLTSVLQEMGVEKIEVFGDGRSALDFLKNNPDNDLIIQEWKIPQITGPIFLQRAKDEAAQTAPFILYTSLIDSSDAQFLKEMGVAFVMNKPLPRAEIIKNIIWTVQQERSPTDKKTLERKFRQALEEKDGPGASEIMTRYMSGSVSTGAKLLMEAEFAYFEGAYEKARDLAFDSLKNAGDSIFLLNLLGKVMMQLRDIGTALKCFEKAQALAPQNLVRLCQIAEIQADLGETEKSQASLAVASELDPDSVVLQETRAKIAINAGSDDAMQLMSQLKDAGNVVSSMNNLAVAMARCGKIEDGIAQYKKTMRAIPNDRVDLLATVQFNLALAHLRANALDPAKEILVPLSQGFTKMQGKSAAILKRMKQAETLGVPIQFKKEPSVETLPSMTVATDTGGGSEVLEPKEALLDNRHEELVSALISRPGDRCCYMIFQMSSQPPQVKKMLEQKLRYKKRDVINKDQTR
ncbi:MAG: response regulator [Chitinophagaceae bacterium]|nr:response regulator [Oligoflexus sp.]